MASSLSDEEFQRLQIQLLELRTANYQYEDQCKKQERELLAAKTECEQLDKELQKATKTLNKSKKAKEVELLLQENVGLQRKLMSQEDEFRLQNETLMKELGQLVTVNENLEKENQSLKVGGSADKEKQLAESELQNEVRHLQAQNSALQKNIASCQKKYETERSSLQQTIADLEVQCLKLSGQRGTPVGEGSSERTVEGESEPELVTGDCSDGPEKSSEEEHRVNLVNKENNTQFKLNEQIKLVNDLNLNLDTEREEKRILQEELQSFKKSSKEQVTSLQEEVEKLTEKFKKKQESLVHLQEEKENQYTELSQKLEDQHSAKTAEIQSLQEQVGKLQAELGQLNQILEEERANSSHQMQELENSVANLQNQVDEASADNNQQLTLQNQQFQHQLQELRQELARLGQENEDYKAQLKESQHAQQTSLDQLYAVQEDRDKQIQALQESNRVAEKRKCLLDELAIKYQTESDQHREQIKSAEEQHQKEIEELNTQIDELLGKVAELDPLRNELEQTKAQLHSLENSKGWLERRLNETEDNLNTTREELETNMESNKREHEDSICRLNEEHLEEVQKLKEDIEAADKAKEEQDATITKLKQEIKDGVDDKKLHEKKGLTVLKDLKRQLQAERKRGEKLQERLQELLSDSKDKHAMDELLRSADASDRSKWDNSSLSSWSASGLGRDGSALSGMSPEDELPASQLEHENADLLKRLTAIQQEKWMLEEKVNHLESSNAAMCDDLLQKTAIIEHYVMDSKLGHVATSPSQEKITLKKVVDFVNHKGDESMRDINRKLQRMLEETLTKNMHLQQNLETLSQEVFRLSKAGESPATTPDK